MFEEYVWGWPLMRDAFQELRNLKMQMDRLMFGEPQYAQYPAINTWMGKNDALLAIEMPGVNPETLEVSLDGGNMRICGSRPGEEENEAVTYYRRERSEGQFSRTIRLPFPIDIQQVEAKYEKGILLVSLPRAEEEKRKTINVTPK